MLMLRRRRFDTLAYLAPSSRNPGQLRRDRRFFAFAGIKRFIGMTGFVPVLGQAMGSALPTTASEADLLLARLAASGIPVPPPRCGSLELRLGEVEAHEVEGWLSTLSCDLGKAWFAVGPGSKMAAKRWPIENFREVGRRLIEEFDLWPVVFGSEEERPLGERLLQAFGRGYNAAGALSLRGAAAALARCRFYLGNDTGTMHLAAAVGIRCVAIFSARDLPGKWAPYGDGHIVLRVGIECEGCMLETCVDRKNACLTAITPNHVWEVCRQVAQVGDLVPKQFGVPKR
jgi:ADP-heptose:LPS heptosyltransferase